MLYIVAAIVGLCLGALLFWQAWHLIKSYKKAIGTPWQKFLAAFSDSATILLARCTAFFGGVTTFISTLLPSLDPSTPLGQTIASLFNEHTAKFWLAGIGGLGLLFEYVRRRPGSVDPILPPAVGVGDAPVAASVAPIAPVTK